MHILYLCAWVGEDEEWRKGPLPLLFSPPFSSSLYSASKYGCFHDKVPTAWLNTCVAEVEADMESHWIKYICKKYATFSVNGFNTFHFLFSKSARDYMMNQSTSAGGNTEHCLLWSKLLGKSSEATVFQGRNARHLYPSCCLKKKKKRMDVGIRRLLLMSEEIFKSF